MKTKIVIIGLIAFGAMASFASTRKVQKSKTHKTAPVSRDMTTGKSGGFVSEEF
jgi:hypothetical protein